ncbi:hypothetical protein CBL_10999 [Carabus blaptoides fortunei]
MSPTVCVRLPQTWRYVGGGGASVQGNCLMSRDKQSNDAETQLVPPLNSFDIERDNTAAAGDITGALYLLTLASKCVCLRLPRGSDDAAGKYRKKYTFSIFIHSMTLLICKHSLLRLSLLLTTNAGNR